MTFIQPGQTAVTGSQCSESSPCNKDDIGEIRSAFVFCCLLDTTDSYHHCDGDRLFRNAKFEFLLCDATNHTKYQLNLWRKLALDLAILAELQWSWPNS